MTVMTKSRARAGKLKASTASKPERAKGKTLNLRVDTKTRALIDLAAQALGQTRTEFMLTTVRERAAEVLLNQRLFLVNETSWRTFVGALDNPPLPNAKLKALLARAPQRSRHA